jgi:hypothetical protein
MAYFKVLFQYSPGDMTKTMKPSVSIINILAKIRTRYLPSTSLECYYYTNYPSKHIFKLLFH